MKAVHASKLIVVLWLIVATLYWKPSHCVDSHSLDKWYFDCCYSSIYEHKTNLVQPKLRTISNEQIKGSIMHRMYVFDRMHRTHVYNSLRLCRIYHKQSSSDIKLQKGPQLNL